MFSSAFYEWEQHKINFIFSILLSFTSRCAASPRTGPVYTSSRMGDLQVLFARQGPLECDSKRAEKHGDAISLGSSRFRIKGKLVSGNTNTRTDLSTKVARRRPVFEVQSLLRIFIGHRFCEKTNNRLHCTSLFLRKNVLVL